MREKEQSNLNSKLFFFRLSLRVLEKLYVSSHSINILKLVLIGILRLHKKATLKMAIVMALAPPAAGIVTSQA